MAKVACATDGRGLALLGCVGPCHKEGCCTPSRTSSEANAGGVVFWYWPAWSYSGWPFQYKHSIDDAWWETRVAFGILARSIIKLEAHRPCSWTVRSAAHLQHVSIHERRRLASINTSNTFACARGGVQCYRKPPRVDSRVWLRL